MNKQARTILHLSLIRGVGPVVIARLIERFPAISDVYHATVADLAPVISHRTADMVVKGLAEYRLFDQECALIERDSMVCILTIADDLYPTYLREIYAPPAVLYIKGSLPSGQNMLACVGSRAADSYAQKAVNILLPPLIASGWTIVSGGAYGVDAMAHACAVSQEGRSVAVLGSGLLEPYPRRNSTLFDNIIAHKGALISTFPMRAPAAAGNFPSRNRVIAGLSRGTVVVQAAERSGALITARFTREYGRELFVVPGRIDHPLSAGCHWLVQGGAHLASSARGIQEIFGEDVAVQKDTKAAEHPVVSACREPRIVDDIVEQTGLSLAQVHAELFNLQLDGLIERTASGLWVAR